MRPRRQPDPAAMRVMGVAARARREDLPLLPSLLHQVKAGRTACPPEVGREEHDAGGPATEIGRRVLGAVTRSRLFGNQMLRGDAKKKTKKKGDWTRGRAQGDKEARPLALHPLVPGPCRWTPIAKPLYRGSSSLLREESIAVPGSVRDGHLRPGPSLYIAVWPACSSNCFPSAFFSPHAL